VLVEVGLTRADLERALAELERREGIPVRSIVGINYDGVFGSTRAGWHPVCPMPARSPSSPCSGSRSWSCWAGCPRAAPPGSSRTERRRAQCHLFPDRQLTRVTGMDTDQLEHDMNELCHEWMSGKAPTDGVYTSAAPGALS
jgi:hypothetical protein